MADWFVPQAKKPEIKLSPAIPNNHRLAFTSWRGGTPDIFTMNWDGTQMVRHTDTDDANSFPLDAGDGKRIIFRRAATENGNMSEFFTVDLSTGMEERYEEESPVEGAIEATTNTQATLTAYAKNEGAFRELFIYDHGSGRHEQITRHKEENISAMIHRSWWSPDGYKLAYLAGEDYYNLYLTVYDVKSKETTRVTPRGYMFSGVVWLKGGDRFIVNIAIRNEMSYELWGINLDGSDLKQLTNSPGRGNLHPQLSPDGNWIAFESGRDMDDGEIYLMRPDGSEQTRITYNPSYEGRPAWVIVK